MTRSPLPNPSPPLAFPPACSLLTSFTFLKLAAKFFSGIEGARKHMGILYGLGVDGESALKGYVDGA